jgi:ferrochelatase
VKVVTRQIVKLPTALIYFLADYRSTKHYLDWRLNRYESSLVAINREQKNAIARSIAELSAAQHSTVDIDVRDAYYFVPPHLEDILPDLRKNYDGVVVVPMIPVESSFSCGVACQMAVDAYGDSVFERVRVLSRLWKDEELHRIYIEHLFSRLSSEFREGAHGKKGLVLVIHGTLVRDRSGNPPKVFTGLEETMTFFGLMREKILADPRNVFDGIKLGCLNHSAGGEWTAETIEKALLEFRQEGFGAVAMFPYGYFADNSETDYEAKKQLDRSGIPVMQYIPCINESSDFCRWLAKRIIDETGILDKFQDTLDELEKRTV